MEQVAEAPEPEEVSGLMQGHSLAQLVQLPQMEELVVILVLGTEAAAPADVLPSIMILTRIRERILLTEEMAQDLLSLAVLVLDI